jgi:O-succinylbenzoate synthase
MLSYSKVSLPLVRKFKTSFGTQLTRDAIIFMYQDGEIEAFSEAVTDDDPFYSYEDNSTVTYIVRKYLADIFTPEMEPEKFNEKASKIRGHNMAKGALEMLLWDINSKREGKPLYRFIGKSRGYAEVGISIGMSSIDDEIETVAQSLKMGYRRIKVKIEKGFDVQILNAIREKFGNIPLSADANQAYSREDFDTLKEIDKFNLLYLEQPLPLEDIRGHALLRKKIETPICLDESIISTEAAVNAIESEAVDVINIKPGRVGGFHNSIDIMEKARGNGIDVWIGGMLETGVGRSYNISLASSSLVTMAGDTSPNSRYFNEDITNETFRMQDGIIKPFERAGIGVSINLKFLKKMEKEGGRIID